LKYKNGPTFEKLPAEYRPVSEMCEALPYDSWTMEYRPELNQKR